LTQISITDNTIYKEISTVDVVIPVYNEEKCLRENTLALHEYLEKTAHFSWNIVIADNASTDKTPQIAAELSSEYEKIQYVHVSLKGRGHALRKTFLESSADVVCYMDVDLSTNLRYLKLMVEGIACGFDVAVGSRLMRGSRVKRKLKREIFSRGYNWLIKLLFLNSFSDAQCGFKALRTDVAKQLVPIVKNNNWFFDTELLLLAEHNRYKILEVPVEWTEDVETKVHIIKYVLEDIAGLLRMRFSIHRKAS
jgi:glycosyltransferase involved in cell wall biosynthesis